MKRLYLLFIFHCLAIFGQDPYSIKFGIEEGLPTSNVYSVFEDNDGFLWFGTDVGVLRFDGYTFEHFSTDDGLSDNEVFNVYQDSQNRIWFLTLNGSLSFLKDGKFYNTKNNTLLKNASHDKLVVDAFEIDDFLFILYRDGQIRKINLKTNHIESFQTPATLFGYWIDGDQPIYLTLESVLDHNMKLLHSFSDQMNPYFAYRTVNFNSKKIFANKIGLLEVTSSGIVKHDNPKINEDIIDLEQIDNGLWIGTRNGLLIKSESNIEKHFHGDIISNSLKDRQGNYWITTLNNGIKFIPNFHLKQYDTLNERIKITSLQFDDSNNLWIGSEKGLFNLTSDSNKLVRPFNNIIQDEYIKNISSFSNNIVVTGNNKSFILDNNDTKTYGFGANDFHFNGSHYFIASSMVYKCLPSEVDKIPSLTNNEEKNKHKFKDYNIFKRRTNVLESFDDHGIFFGTTTGLFVYKNDSIYRINKKAEELNSSIHDIHFNGRTKEYAVATNSKGVSILKGERIKHHISKRQELSSNTCYVIKPFGESLLVGTNKGLDKIEFQNDEIRVSSINQLLRIDEEKINDIAINDSLIYLATDKGLLSFDWSTIKANNAVPSIVIQNVLINNTKPNNLFDLKSSENNLSIVFTGISFSDFSKLIYQYRINDGPWNTTNNRNLEIKNLSSGSQTIEIRAQGTSGIWSKSKQIQLKINPPFYKTVPFILIILIALLTLLYFLIGKRIASLKKGFNKERKMLKAKQQQIQIEKQMLDLEQKALRMQMNPHFIFNALNTIKGYYSGGNLKEANSYITKLSRLLRLILENDERLISIDKEIEIITLYIKLIQLRYVDVFDYNIIVDPEINQSETGLPSLILQPLVENAIIHGLAPLNKKGKLTITFEKVGEKLICKVIDNGVGYSKSLKKNNAKSENTSKALKITKERIDIENHNSENINFEIKDGENNQGTEVIIKLPILNIW
ncbi:sensor histidine kinase [Winogradskyella vincentii]|uniref:Histidine kinase n=1 Tax=Winogradskyella vincentii TaxID=2877122 RepID=A0ABS7Y0X6_9FLAO|nr:histidine kinase [Winogradskyella vincentii]MCA0153578.1 histidine kinase [Winogradskyella vincentii]